MVDNKTDFDAIVVGGGHNGLVTANYLAMGGLRVCVLEQRHIVGGAAVSEEFHPGYRNSIASFVVLSQAGATLVRGSGLLLYAAACAHSSGDEQPRRMGWPRVQERLDHQCLLGDHTDSICLPRNDWGAREYARLGPGLGCRPSENSR